MDRNKLPAYVTFGWLTISALNIAESAEFVPPDDGYDWLQLTSGEWLRGEFIGLFNEEIEFDSDILDDLTIDEEDVEQLHSSRRFGISIRGYDLLRGQVRIESEEIIVVVGSEERSYERSELVALTGAAERERDRWSGDLNLGVNLRQGNTDVVEYNMIAGVERRTPQSRTFIDYIGNYNETESELVANNHRLGIVLDRFSGARLFWRPFIGQYFRDPFQNIAHQSTIETGLGYELIGTRRTEWQISASVGGTFVRRVSVEQDQEKGTLSPSLSFGMDYDTEITSWMDYLFSFTGTFLDEESGTYQHHLLTTLSTDLVGDLDLDISFVWDRTERPQQREDGTFPEKDDFRLIVSVGFEF